jgi:hypothetical protein
MPKRGGREKMEKLDDALDKGNVVALFGTAQGTYSVNGNLLSENHWEISAAWKAVVRVGASRNGVSIRTTSQSGKSWE